MDGIKIAYEKGMGISVMNPLSGGIIIKNPNVFTFLTEGTNLNLAQSTLKFLVSHKEISVVMVGFSEKENVDDAVKSTEYMSIKPMSEICK